METHKDKPTFYASSRQEWRNWLMQNHKSEKCVWLIIYKKESKIPTVYYPEAVDEAICFGWIDSTINKRDGQSYYQYFAKRNPKSNWSRVNKEKVAQLLSTGLMENAGLKMIQLAQESGTWTALDDVENICIPNDLKAILEANRVALQNWGNFPRSSKRNILEWILNAKRPETRQKRIIEVVALAEKNIKANQERQ